MNQKDFIESKLRDEFNQEFYESHSWIEINDHIATALKESYELGFINGCNEKVQHDNDIKSGL